MPFNNENWGEEKTEGLLESIINTLSLLDEFEKRTDEFKEEDFKQNLRGQFSTMTVNITKLYAFFLNGEWKQEDRDLILREKSEGLKKVKAIYQLAQNLP